MQNQPILRPPFGHALQRLAIAAVLGITVIVALGTWAPRYLALAGILLPVLTIALVLPVLRK